MVTLRVQPPSGGCVLKLVRDRLNKIIKVAAAFGRLCVETNSALVLCTGAIAAAFGRLCVETNENSTLPIKFLAAAFGRLCVETRRDLLPENST